VTMENIRDIWWLVGVVLAILAVFVRYAIKVNDAAKGIEKVAAHDTDIKQIKAQSDRIERDIVGLRESLDEHTTLQKKDIRAIHEALLAILGRFKDDGPDSAVGRAKDNLIDNLMDR